MEKWYGDKIADIAGTHLAYSVYRLAYIEGGLRVEYPWIETRLDDQWWSRGFNVKVLRLPGDIRAMVELAKNRTSCEYLLVGDLEGIFVRWETDHVWSGSILPGNYRKSR